MTLQFRREDEGNQRVYYGDVYKGARLLYCWQYEGLQGWKFYRCSADGEPSHEVRHADTTPEPPGNEPIGWWLIQFLRKQK